MLVTAQHPSPLAQLWTAEADTLHDAGTETSGIKCNDDAYALS